MLNLCITFDYELFFGKNNGTDKEILFEPTQKLINVLSQEGVSATFFADTCSIQQNKRIHNLDYVTRFTEQICDMYRNKQDVQLHIHPHWLRSVYEGNEWKFDSESYRLHSFGFDKSKQDNVYSIIKEGINYLETEIRRIDPDYQCIAYRAGGFTLQPHQEMVKALYDSGIRVDSSVAPMLCSQGTNSYDFRNEILNTNWYISPDGEWWEDNPSEKSLLEIPVATENKNPLAFLLKRVFMPGSVKLNLGSKRGSYIDTGNTQKKNNIIRSGYGYISGYNAMSMDAYQADFLYGQIKRFMRKHDCINTDCSIALIGHPKLVTDKYLSNLKRLINLIKEDENDACIKSISQIYAEIRMKKS